MTAAAERTRLFSGPHRPLTVSLMAAIALVSYNNLSVAAALPNIGNDLGRVSLLPWIITAELLAGAVAILGIGPTVDSYGVRRVFRLAMLTFMVFSILCALSPSMPALIVFRIGQGVASGGVIGSAVSSIGLAFESAVRPKVYAMISAVWGIMGIAGPAIAAVLISVFGWRSIFSATVPVAAIATAVGWNRLPDRRDDNHATKFDRRGLLLVGVVAVGLLMAASTSSLWGFAWVLASLVGGVVYVRHARTHQAPVVLVDHLVGRRWRYLHITSTLAVAGGTGASAFLPLYLRGARGASESEAAFSVLFLVVGWSVGAYVSSKMQERMHAAFVVRAGSAVLICATTSATIVAWLDSPLPILLGLFFLIGLGIGSLTTSGLALLQSRAEIAEMGRVSSAHQFLRSLGFAYGAAIAGAVLFFVVSRRIGDVEAIRELLGDDVGRPLSLEAIEALKAGYVWALATTAGLTAITATSAVKLVRSIGMFDSPDGPQPDANAMTPPA